MARARHVSTACAPLLAPAESPAVGANWRRQHRDAAESAPHAFRDGVADPRSNRSAGQPAGRPGPDRRRRRKPRPRPRLHRRQIGQRCSRRLACRSHSSRPSQPRWIPPIFADARAAWEGAYPDRPDVPIRIEAAAVRGRPVYFEIVAPWTRPRNEDAHSGQHVGRARRLSTCAPPWHRWPLSIAVLLALRNLRLGRGDRRGALRLSMFILAAGAASNALETGDLSGAHQRARARVLRPGIRVAAVYRARTAHAPRLA